MRENFSVLSTFDITDISLIYTAALTLFLLMLLMLPSLLTAGGIIGTAAGPAGSFLSGEVRANGFCYEPYLPAEEAGAGIAHLPGRETAGMQTISLSDLAEYYGWEIEREGDRVIITVLESEELEARYPEDELDCPAAMPPEPAENGAEEVSFYLDEMEFAGEELFQSPVVAGDEDEDEGEIFIGPELTRLLVRELRAEEIKYAAWLEADDTFYRSGDEVNVEIKIWNLSGREQTLEFNTGQLYDIMIFRNGWEEWRWSDGRAFTMALQSRRLEPGDHLSWQESFTLSAELESGDYMLTGAVVSRDEIPLNSLPIEIRQR